MFSQDFEEMEQYPESVSSFLFFYIINQSGASPYGISCPHFS